MATTHAARRESTEARGMLVSSEKVASEIEIDEAELKDFVERWGKDHGYDPRRKAGMD